MGLVVILIGCSLFFGSCNEEEIYLDKGTIEINIETGEHWLHDFQLFLGISKKNAPQLAVWVEDTSNNYLFTLFATHKIASEGWIANKGNRRKEALPHWCHQRGILYPDGLYLPTKEDPLLDGITGATPKEDKLLYLNLTGIEEPIIIKVELNHSTDFNDDFPKDAQLEDPDYSGGSMGSGQPALVYAARIFPETDKANFELLGYSSPDGSSGKISGDLTKVTSAKSIVKRISLIVNK